MKIPRIIHQIYFDMEGTGVPNHLSTLSQTWKEMHPAWVYRFWNKETTEQLLETDFSDFLNLYYSFPFDVQRWDFIRYLILYRFGGLYVDFDYECLEPLDPLLENSTCYMGMEPAINAYRFNKPFIVGNALMAAVPGHSYFKHIIKDISAGEWQNIKSQSLQVVESTGPFMTTRVYNTYPKKDEITLLPAELVAPLSADEVLQLIEGDVTPEMEEKVENAFAIHYFWGSWYSQVNS